ncbi:MAG TPA: winged helix-turn-helix domain-containing protein [Acidimicrobiales bacterium]|nr:winged helix-turn-helix domain-containing protein [Acidimicrobiales bacterium]
MVPEASDQGESAGDQAGAVGELRELNDAQTMRALSHPVRIALIEALSLFGVMTATEVGERIGESPTTCSFHLRQLAKYGFIVEAGGGTGRSRPWKLASIGMRIGAVHDDPAAEIAAGILTKLLRERQLARYKTWLDTRSSFPKPWRDAAGEGEFLFYLTAQELEELQNDLLTFLWPRFRERFDDPSRRPEGAAPVEMLVFSYPIELPDSER